MDYIVIHSLAVMEFMKFHQHFLQGNTFSGAIYYFFESSLLNIKIFEFIAKNTSFFINNFLKYWHNCTYMQKSCLQKKYKVIHISISEHIFIADKAHIPWHPYVCKLCTCAKSNAKSATSMLRKICKNVMIMFLHISNRVEGISIRIS